MTLNVVQIWLAGHLLSLVSWKLDQKPLRHTIEDDHSHSRRGDRANANRVLNSFSLGGLWVTNVTNRTRNACRWILIRMALRSSWLISTSRSWMLGPVITATYHTQRTTFWYDPGETDRWLARAQIYWAYPLVWSPLGCVSLRLLPFSMLSVASGWLQSKAMAFQAKKHEYKSLPTSTCQQALFISTFTNTLMHTDPDSRTTQP